ncbi:MULTISPECIES: hypothetical protein, partial [unclassified Rhizobium]|uniref:hypothetical protein n=1 Tax=unclassified Rhizobium TaxID=2613769 RepID=UPI00193D0DA2
MTNCVPKLFTMLLGRRFYLPNRSIFNLAMWSLSINEGRRIAQEVSVGLHKKVRKAVFPVAGLG